MSRCACSRAPSKATTVPIAPCRMILCSRPCVAHLSSPSCSPPQRVRKQISRRHRSGTTIRVWIADSPLSCLLCFGEVFHGEQLAVAFHDPDAHHVHVGIQDVRAMIRRLHELGVDRLTRWARGQRSPRARRNVRPPVSPVLEGWARREIDGRAHPSEPSRWHVCGQRPPVRHSIAGAAIRAPRARGSWRRIILAPGSGFVLGNAQAESKDETGQQRRDGPGKSPHGLTLEASFKPIFRGLPHIRRPPPNSLVQHLR